MMTDSVDFALRRLLHCDRRMHCRNCRAKENGRAFRESVARVLHFADPDWECPFGFSWGAAPRVDMLERASANSTQNTVESKRCIYQGEILSPPHPDRPCRGAKIRCQHPDAPADTWWAGRCRARYCRFFTPEETATPENLNSPTGAS